MLVALAMVRLVASAYDFRSATVLDRVLEAKAALPAVTEQEGVAIFFGSSMMEAAFAPRVFDREMAARGACVRSYNFGFGGLNPVFQEVLARRVRDAFEARGRRLPLAILEFNPFQATEVRWQRAQPVLDAFLAELITSRELWEIGKEDPERGFQLANIVYLRDKVSAEMITHRLGEPLRPGRKKSELAVDREAERRIDELRERLRLLDERDFAARDDREWDLEWQGGESIAEERSSEVLELAQAFYAALRSNRRMDDDRLRRIHTADIEELRFSEELVAAFVRMIGIFQSFADEVDVVLLPRNTDWIEYTPAGRERLQDVLERIERETQAVVRNFQVVDAVIPEMFSDTTHLARYSGDEVFSRFLAEFYSSRWRELMGQEKPPGAELPAGLCESE